MRTSCLLFATCIWVSAQSQMPANTLAPEDASFNALYPNLSIPSVTGRLLNLSADELKTLTITYTLVTPFAAFQDRRIVSPQPDGSFKLVLDYPLPYQQIWLELGDYFYAGLCVNTNLYLELDMKKLKAAKEQVYFNGDGVRYLGADGPLNTYMNDYVLYKQPEQNQLTGKIMALINSSFAAPDSMLPRFNLLFDSVKMIEDSYIALHPSPLSWILQNERMSDYYGRLCIGYWGKIMPASLWEKVKQHKSYLVSNSGALFYRYLTTYVSHLPGGPRPPMGTQATALMQTIDKNIQRIDSAFPPAKADFLKLRLNISLDADEQKTGMEHVLGSMHTPWCVAVEKEQYQLAVAKVVEINKALVGQPGGPPPTGFGDPLIQTSFGASLYKTSGKAMDFLATLKQSFPGKAIIIDRWAIWCGPCLGEMPHSKELQEASKDLPVVFVYLCTMNGTTEAKWKSKVAELKQPGVHILIDETLDAELSHYFSFAGYPGYALIDKAGNYKPGAITWLSEIKNRDALATMIK